MQRVHPPIHCFSILFFTYSWSRRVFQGGIHTPFTSSNCSLEEFELLEINPKELLWFLLGVKFVAQSLWAPDWDMSSCHHSQPLQQICTL